MEMMLKVEWFEDEVEDIPRRVGATVPTEDVETTYAKELQEEAMARYAWSECGGTMAVQSDVS